MVERLRKARRFVTEAEAARESVPDRAAPSLATDAVIAALNPDDGKIWNNAAFAVPGALLVELAHEGRLEVSGTGKKARATLRDATPLGDPELDDALTVVGSGVLGHKVTRLVGGVPHTDQLVRRLVADGILVEESQRRLGMFTVRRYQPGPSAHREQLVARLRSALLGESVPDRRTAMLIAVLVDVHPKLFVPRKQVGEARRRAEEILERIGEAEQAIVSAVKVAMSDTDGYASNN
ncbi:GOLPH3/VPS74 family protein [Nocardioides sp. GXQ0305]|uniref:GOLPH3/VPS74 family protein n=1 Tax=Nocardioides sp. GXQ0305 TaxID=3423912 RepID=UPI003D7EFDC3